MDQFLNISLIQTDIIWEEPKTNFAIYEEKINTLEFTPDLIILPEMFNSGFSMSFSEKPNSESCLWMKKIASKTNTNIFGSVAISEDNKKYNRGLWVTPEGQITHYDKKHLFKYGKEHLSFSPGDNITTTQIGEWKIRPLICYDLRFPIWSRNTAPYYDLLIYVASWPMARIEAWKTLLKARAIENQCYVIGVNRIGQDGNGLVYNGQSLVVDFQGKVILDAEDQNGIFSTKLSLQNLSEFRSRFPFLDDSDQFTIEK